MTDAERENGPVGDSKPLKIDSDKTVKHADRLFKFKELVAFYTSSYDRINHQIYRRIVKKVQRKFNRQTNAALIEALKQKYPTVDSRPINSSDIIENESNEAYVAKQREKEHKIWLEREQLAQIEWRAKKEKELRIQLIKKLNQKIEDKTREKQNENSRQSSQQPSRFSVLHANNIVDLSQQALTLYHNPVLSMDEINEMARQKCKFFQRTGVCKYGNLCNRAHIADFNGPLRTLIFPSMYTNMLLGYELLQLNTDSDDILEYEESDILAHFTDFYDDVLDEIKKFGRVEQFLTCSNYLPHLRGNVYVQYQREEDATNAYINLNGRFYAGKQIFCYFTHVTNWKDAVCGLFLRNKCEKGAKCNYMHVFQSPYNHFPLIGEAKNGNNKTSSGPTSRVVTCSDSSSKKSKPAPTAVGSELAVEKNSALPKNGNFQRRSIRRSRSRSRSRHKHRRSSGERWRFRRKSRSRSRSVSSKKKRRH